MFVHNGWLPSAIPAIVSIAMWTSYIRYRTEFRKLEDKLVKDEPGFATMNAQRRGDDNHDRTIPNLSVEDLAWLHMVLRDVASILERLQK